MISTARRYFGFRLLDRRLARVTHFFDIDDAMPLRAGLKAVAEELERIKQAVDHASIDAQFEELIRPRETIFRFDPPRAVLTAVPEATLADLFGRYVEHDFETKTPQEGIMEQGLRQLLKQARLADQYHAKEIGDDEFHVKFPFVREQQDRIKVIKPLHLTHAEPVRAIEHGLLWAGRIKRLQKHNLLQGEILFTLQGGLDDTPNLRAKREVEEILREVNARVADHIAEAQILAFASAA